MLNNDELWVPVSKNIADQDIEIFNAPCDDNKLYKENATEEQYNNETHALSSVKFKNMESTLAAIYCYSLKVNVSSVSPYLKNSFSYNSLLEKQRCRIAQYLCMNSKSQFSSEDLAQVVEDIDTIAGKPLLYEPILKERAKFLMKEPISAQTQWEKVLRPLKQYHANIHSGYLNMPCLGTGLLIILIHVIHLKLGKDAWTYDLSTLVEKLSNCQHYNQVEEFTRSSLLKALPESKLTSFKRGL